MAYILLPDDDYQMMRMIKKKKLKHRDISYVYAEASYSPAIEVFLVNKTDSPQNRRGLISTDLVYYKYLIGRSWKIINP